MKGFVKTVGAAVAAVSMLGCVGVAEDVGGGKGGGEFKGDAIDAQNDPARFDPSLERVLDRLPQRGEATRVPWSGDYWASRNDSINHQWDGSELSPAAKYAQAFGKPGVPDAVSRLVGTASSTEEIPGWVGICEGWAAAAIVEPAPVNPVTRNGVTFYPGDLEGLMSLLYARGNSPSKFLSRRCNDEEVRFDEHGRPVSAACRDVNPGSLHIIVTNYLGIKGESLVEDRTYDAEVWNQPLRGYEITTQREVTMAEANSILGGTGAGAGERTVVFPRAAIAMGEEQAGSVTMPASGVLHVVLSGDGDADLHVNEGAPATTSTFSCRPYAGNSEETCTVRAPEGTVVHWMVSGYAATSNVEVVTVVPSAGDSYAFNPAAKRFAEVRMTLKYITESPPARTSHIDQIDSYTRNDSYHYILELDASGKIIGGEYVGDSRTAHPDFLWLPTGTPFSEIAGIRYSDVKSLFNEAARP